MLGLFRLLGFRTVRWAKIDKELRDTCERYGEPVMQAFITAPAGPQARDLQKKSSRMRQRTPRWPHGSPSAAISAPMPSGGSSSCNGPRWHSPFWLLRSVSWPLSWRCASRWHARF
jgi:hypothetical protein